MSKLRITVDIDIPDGVSIEDVREALRSQVGFVANYLKSSCESKVDIIGNAIGEPW